MPRAAVEEDLQRKLTWLMTGRLVASTGLLGSAVLLHARAPGTVPVSPFFFLIGLTYALTIVYAVTRRLADRHRWLVDAQLVCDALIVSGFIYVTGGITSYFSSLYVLPILAASTMRFSGGALRVAVLSAAIYAGMVFAQYVDLDRSIRGRWSVDPSLLLPPPRVAQYTVAINGIGLLAVAALGGSLAERLRRADASLARASTEIASLQAFNEYVIESLTSGLVAADGRGRILTFNRAAETITGHRADAVAGRPLTEVLQLPASLVPALEAKRGGGPLIRRTEFHYKTNDDRAIEIGMSAARLMTAGGPAGVVITFQDLTEVKELEREARLQQRLAAVGEMAAAIAHEIRNPLASISGSIQVLRQELPLSRDQARLLDIVLRESGRLNDTIRSFLAYARPERFAVARLDLRRSIDDAAMLLRNGADVQANHRVDVDLPATEVWCEADEGQIRQIVWNLATNGLRAMPHGGRLCLRAGIESGRTDQGKTPGAVPNVFLSVDDEGIGISPEVLDDVFQPFRGAFARGSGLGLAIVHRIVCDYQGDIHVTSTPGVGTTVRVRLPARVAAVVDGGAASVAADRIRRGVVA